MSAEGSFNFKAPCSEDNRFAWDVCSSPAGHVGLLDKAAFTELTLSHFLRKWNEPQLTHTAPHPRPPLSMVLGFGKGHFHHDRHVPQGRGSCALSPGVLAWLCGGPSGRGQVPNCCRGPVYVPLLPPDHLPSTKRGRLRVLDCPVTEPASDIPKLSNSRPST